MSTEIDILSFSLFAILNKIEAFTPMWHFNAPQYKQSPDPAKMPEREQGEAREQALVKRSKQSLGPLIQRFIVSHIQDTTCDIP